MLSRYDATQAARVDCEFIRKYDTTQNARVDCEFVRAYDDTAAAWVDRLIRDNYFTIYTASFYNGGGYSVSEDKKTISFAFKRSGYGTVDSVSLQWKGREVVNDVFMGEFESSDSTINPDVYFYYEGRQVFTQKLRTQDNNLFGIAYEGAVDEIVINITPQTESTFSLINLYFGQELIFKTS